VSSLCFTEDRRSRVFYACVVIGFGGASIDSWALTTFLSIFQPESDIPNSFPDSTLDHIFADKDVVFGIRRVALRRDI
jgi:hypothetical protein